jgi:hypothetical protein
MLVTESQFRKFEPFEAQGANLLAESIAVECGIQLHELEEVTH